MIQQSSACPTEPITVDDSSTYEWYRITLTFFNIVDSWPVTCHVALKLPTWEDADETLQHCRMMHFFSRNSPAKTNSSNYTTCFCGVFPGDPTYSNIVLADVDANIAFLKFMFLAGTSCPGCHVKTKWHVVRPAAWEMYIFLWYFAWRNKMTVHRSQLKWPQFGNWILFRRTKKTVPVNWGSPVAGLIFCNWTDQVAIQLLVTSVVGFTDLKTKIPKLETAIGFELLRIETSHDVCW